VRTLLSRLLLGAALLLSACRSGAGEGTVVGIEQSPPEEREQPTLAPPDADRPAVGSCAEAQGAEAVVSLNPDFPDPRCLIVNPDQRLRIVSRLDGEVQVALGSVSVIVGPGFDGVIGPRFGDYLEPGVHFLGESTYEGNVEIWLR
jgi:hypothetical protein